MATPAIFRDYPSGKPQAARKPPPPERLWLHALLFVVTFLSTTLVGMRYQNNFNQGLFPLSSDADIFPYDWVWHHLNQFASGLPFSCCLLGILLTHEFGHYFAARHYKIRATLPYMLPAPSLSGTAGAVIRLRSRIKSRAALLSIGALGPLSGFLVATCTTVVGLLLSKPVAVEPTKLVYFNSPLLVTLLMKFINGPLHRNVHEPLLWHPVFIASWIGLLITSLNLVPAGQLDGGHILYSISPKFHRVMTYTAISVLVFMGVRFWMGWLLWTGLLLLPGMRHPTVRDESPLPRRLRVLPPIALCIFILCATPAPFKHMSLRDALARYETQSKLQDAQPASH